MTKKGKKPYGQRTEIEKIKSQWTKIDGLLSGEEWSAAVVRAATAAELAATFAIRQEFNKSSEFSKSFVDSLLLWANGIKGKIDKILSPMLKGRPHYKDIKDLFPLAITINDKRNSIAHKGEFCKRSEAYELIAKCRDFVQGVVQHYEEDFELPEIRRREEADE